MIHVASVTMAIDSPGRDPWHFKSNSVVPIELDEEILVRIAAVQCDVQFADRSTNLETVNDRIDVAAGNDASLIVFPECMLCGYTYRDRDEAWQQAITLDDPSLTTIANHLASFSHPVAITIGTLLRVEEKLFNASILIDSTGVVGHYRKVHLPKLGVDQFVDRGDQPYRSHHAAGINVGMAICYDCSFPEPMRILGLAGVDVVALGTNWPVAAERTAEVVPPARSMENHYYFVAANRVGTERGFTFCGRSSICGPDGVVLAASDDDREEILFADIDLEAARNKRIERTAGAHEIDRMADRRPEFYGRISESN